LNVCYSICDILGQNSNALFVTVSEEKSELIGDRKRATRISPEKGPFVLIWDHGGEKSCVWVIGTQFSG
jgi:hypothetical protein